MALGATVLVYLGGCGSGGGGNGETTISGNVAQRSAFRTGKAARSSLWALLRSLRFVGAAYAHSGVDGLDVCVEQCPQGLDGSGSCGSPEPTSFCTSTDSGGDFTVRGDMSGDLCVRVTDSDDPGFLGRTCVAGVPQGGTVTMGNMSCRSADHTCRPDEVQMMGRP
jgi:hypothetical protein